VKEGYGDLLMANSGELLGLPQLDPKTGSLNVILKFAEGDPRAAALQEAFKSGRKYRVDWVTITPVGQPTFYDAEPAPAEDDKEAGKLGFKSAESSQRQPKPRELRDPDLHVAMAKINSRPDAALSVSSCAQSRRAARGRPES
jgi:hypothetical protein